MNNAIKKIYLGMFLLICSSFTSQGCRNTAKNEFDSGSNVASITFKTPQVDFDTLVLEYLQSAGESLRKMEFKNDNSRPMSSTFNLPAGQYLLVLSLKKGDAVIAKTIDKNSICPNVSVTLNPGNNNLEFKLCKSENPMQTLIIPSTIPQQGNPYISSDANIIVDTKICDAQGNCTGGSPTTCDINGQNCTGAQVAPNANTQNNVVDPASTSCAYEPKIAPDPAAKAPDPAKRNPQVAISPIVLPLEFYTSANKRFVDILEEAKNNNPFALSILDEVFSIDFKNNTQRGYLTKPCDAVKKDFLNLNRITITTPALDTLDMFNPGLFQNMQLQYLKVNNGKLYSIRGVKHLKQLHTLELQNNLIGYENLNLIVDLAKSSIFASAKLKLVILTNNYINPQYFVDTFKQNKLLNRYPEVEASRLLIWGSQQ